MIINDWIMGNLLRKFICYQDSHIIKKVNYVHIDKFNHLKGENRSVFLSTESGMQRLDGLRFLEPSPLS